MSTSWSAGAVADRFYDGIMSVARPRETESTRPQPQIDAFFAQTLAAWRSWNAHAVAARAAGSPLAL